MLYTNKLVKRIINFPVCTTSPTKKVFFSLFRKSKVVSNKFLILKVLIFNFLIFFSNYILSISYLIMQLQLTLIYHAKIFSRKSGVFPECY